MSDTNSLAPAGAVADSTPAVVIHPATTPAVDTTVSTTVSTETPAETQENAGQPRDPATGQFAPKEHPRAVQIRDQIAAATRDKHAVLREVQMLRGEAARLREESAKPVNVDPADYAGQTAAAIDKRLSERSIAETERRADNLTRHAAAKNDEILDAQMSSIRDTIPDIDIILAHPSAGGPVITSAMAEALARTDNGALVAYHLAKNPVESRRIAALSQTDPLGASMEIGRLAARVTAQPIKRISQAPAPVSTVSGGNGGGGAGIDLNTASYADYEKFRMAEDRKRIGA